MAPSFRMVCGPATLAGAPAGWAAETLRDGELALLIDAGGLEAVTRAAHDLDLLTVPIVRAEDDAGAQQRTVMAFAGSFPLIWVAQEFDEAVLAWARDRGPMTLLVAHQGTLPEPQRARIGRFVALLARQTE